MHRQFPPADQRTCRVKQTVSFILPELACKDRVCKPFEIFSHSSYTCTVLPKIDRTAFHRRAFSNHQRTICISCKKSLAGARGQKISRTTVTAVIFTFFGTLDLLVNSCQQFFHRLVADFYLLRPHSAVRIRRPVGMLFIGAVRIAAFHRRAVCVRRVVSPAHPKAQRLSDAPCRTPCSPICFISSHHRHHSAKQRSSLYRRTNCTRRRHDGCSGRREDCRCRHCSKRKDTRTSRNADHRSFARQPKPCDRVRLSYRIRRSLVHSSVKVKSCVSALFIAETTARSVRYRIRCARAERLHDRMAFVFCIRPRCFAERRQRAIQFLISISDASLCFFCNWLCQK